jgi:hypothetical protein
VLEWTLLMQKDKHEQVVEKTYGKAVWMDQQNTDIQYQLAQSIEDQRKVEEPSAVQRICCEGLQLAR